VARDDCRPLILSLRENFREGSLGKKNLLAFANELAKVLWVSLTLAPSRISLVVCVCVCVLSSSFILYLSSLFLRQRRGAASLPSA
jgi:hypothetical protein